MKRRRIAMAHTFSPEFSFLSLSHNNSNNKKNRGTVEREKKGNGFEIDFEAVKLKIKKNLIQANVEVRMMGISWISQHYLMRK